MPSLILLIHLLPRQSKTPWHLSMFGGMSFGPGRAAIAWSRCSESPCAARSAITMVKRSLRSIRSLVHGWPFVLSWSSTCHLAHSRCRRPLPNVWAACLATTRRWQLERPWKLRCLQVTRPIFAPSYTAPTACRSTSGLHGPPCAIACKLARATVSPSPFARTQFASPT